MHQRIGITRKLKTFKKKKNYGNSTKPLPTAHQGRDPEDSAFQQA
jgi:hypothetical protein